MLRRFACTAVLLLTLPILAAPAPAPPPAPTAKEAEAFLADAERRLLELWIAAERAGWVQSNFITDDTERIAADARQAVIAATMDLAAQATRFDGAKLPAELSRK